MGDTGSRMCAVRSDVGQRRTNNEDACAVSVVDGTVLNWTGQLPPGSWALVADGMGGHAAGEVASIVALAVMRLLLQRAHDVNGIRAGLMSANESLFDAMDDDPELWGMGTTIAGIVLRDTSALLFNVGDSRIYLRRAAGLTQLSEDHVVEGNMLTQCLGGVDRQASLLPFIREINLRPDDELLICSDGLTDMVTDQQIEQLWGATPSDTSDSLVGAALQSGGSDNVSVIVIGTASSKINE